MIVLSEYYLQRIEHIPITQDLTLNLAPKKFKGFVDDSHARFNNREQSLQFLDILNNQDPLIQYTIEFKNESIKTSSSISLIQLSERLIITLMISKYFGKHQ